jgi:hypothetical protein
MPHCQRYLREATEFNKLKLNVMVFKLDLLLSSTYSLLDLSATIIIIYLVSQVIIDDLFDSVQ